MGIHFVVYHYLCGRMSWTCCITVLKYIIHSVINWRVKSLHNNTQSNRPWYFVIITLLHRSLMVSRYKESSLSQILGFLVNKSDTLMILSGQCIIIENASDAVWYTHVLKWSFIILVNGATKRVSKLHPLHTINYYLKKKRKIYSKGQSKSDMSHFARPLSTACKISEA